MEKNVTEWLDRTVHRFPNKIAVCDEAEEITFIMLQKKAKAIAQAIIEKNKGIQKPIAVCMERSVKEVVVFMGIAYSGNFYTPVDIEMPDVRMDKILSVLNPEIIITTSKIMKKMRARYPKALYISYEDVLDDCIVNKNLEHVQKQILDMDILSVLFTSGSTGVPKGVCITHRAIMDHVDFEADLLKITETDNRGSQVSFHYVMSMFDIYSMVRNGSTLFIIPKDLFFQPVLLLEYLKEKEISTISWVPSLMTALSKTKAFEYVDVSKSLKRVMFAGEVMQAKQLKIWQKYLPNVCYVQMYGATEMMVPIYHIVKQEFDENKRIPIGVVRKNAAAFVLDENDKPVYCEDVVGELCVKGAALSVGYYNDIEKTQKVFVQNPLNDSYTERIYRTGDLVRYDENGELVYVSRKDFQIKHGGHRIELGEIETAVVSVEGINECVCLYNKEVKEIVAFIDTGISKRELNNELKRLLPRYMLPSRVITIGCMPLNVNGKIDRCELEKYMRGNI